MSAFIREIGLQFLKSLLSLSSFQLVLLLPAFVMLTAHQQRVNGLEIRLQELQFHQKNFTWRLAIFGGI